jgi:hypothetical protein
MIYGSQEWKLQEADRQRAKGNVRSASHSPALRNAGFSVEMVPILEKYASGFKRRVLPFAPAWAVNLSKKLRWVKVDSKMKQAALVEARELGRPGPLAEALLVAAKMMEKTP